MFNKVPVKNDPYSENMDFQYSIKKSAKAKRIIIRIDKTGQCILVIPKRSRMSQADLHSKAVEFMKSKSSWVVAGIEKIKSKREKSLNELGLDKSLSDHSKKEIQELRKTTLEKINERLQYFNTFYGFNFKDVRVKNMSSRWGSCSKSGNLNFNQSLGVLTPKELDYVVVHELCHIGEFNHSKNFWKLVEQTIPDYKSIKVKMKGRVL